MPSPQNCIDHQPGQCVDLIDIAEHVLDECYRALLPILGPQTDGNILRAYTTVGPGGDDGVVDALCVSFLGAGPTPGSTAGNITTAYPGIKARFQVSLVESGWPMVKIEGSRVTLPGTTEIAAASRHAYAHGEALYRHIISLNNGRRIAPMFPGSVASIGPLTPRPPQAGIVGWIVNFEVLMGWGGG